VTAAEPTLNALLAATAAEGWPAWYDCTRLAVADYLEDRDLPGDRQAAGLVRQARPTAWAQCSVPPGWEVEEVRLARNAPPAPEPRWLRVAVAGYGRGDDAFSSLTDDYRQPGSAGVVDGPCLRPFPLRALRLSAVIPDGSEVSAGVSLRHGHPVHALVYGRYDLKLTPRDARLWCRREVLGLFPDVLVKAPCPHCGGKSAAFVDEVAGTGVLRLNPGTRAWPKLVLCPVCRGRPPRPRPATSLLPTLPAVALPALAPLN
jgi:hypothetical protein